MFIVVCSLGQGLGALCIAWATGFYVLGAGLFFYSFMGSVVQFMCPLIIADGIKEDKQAFAITSSSFLAGPASLATSPLIADAMRGTGSDSLQSWRVAFACSFVYMMQYGVNSLSGVMFVASMSRYGVGRETASFPYTFNNVVMSVARPIVGCLGQKCMVRSVAVFGSILSAVEVGLCYFAEDVATVTLLFGILYGDK